MVLAIYIMEVICVHVIMDTSILDYNLGDSNPCVQGALNLHHDIYLCTFHYGYWYLQVIIIVILTPVYMVLATYITEVICVPVTMVTRE